MQKSPQLEQTFILKRKKLIVVTNKTLLKSNALYKIGVVYLSYWRFYF